MSSMRSVWLRIREPRSILLPVICAVLLALIAWFLYLVLDSSALSMAASVATTLAVFFTGLQVYAAGKQASIEFEDEISREYRALLPSIPIEAVLGGGTNPTDLGVYYRYFDFTNAQVFLRRKGRVSREAWDEWREGIQSTMALPAFKSAWEAIKQKQPGRFNELVQLERASFGCDPRHWSAALRP